MKVSLVCVMVLVASAVLAADPSYPMGRAGFDLRGKWEGEAQGPVFGAKGTVTITAQQGDNIEGIVEGGNFLGTARFSIRGKVQGNMIFGNKDGNVFQGALYADSTIRGTLRAINGEVYHVFLRRPAPAWGSFPYGAYSYPYVYPYEMW